MSAHEWKPGDVAMRRYLGAEQVTVAVTCGNTAHPGLHWHHVSGGWDPMGEEYGPRYRPLVVIDPEDREQVERLTRLIFEVAHPFPGRVDDTAAALREFAEPKPAEPTDPSARVTDRRGNIWRLLADGDWVCTSGPDVGEYLVWRVLADDRGPLSIEAAS